MSGASDLLEIEGLDKNFSVASTTLFGRRALFRAVENVSFSVRDGEVFGLVGESGSGKTTIGRTVIRLYDPDGGRISFEGRDICALKGSAVKEYRSKCQMIFQDSYASLNPVKRVYDLIAEPLRAYGWPRREISSRIEYLVDRVGLDESFLSRYPHQFSGGQRQRIGIARALSLNPRLVICDEPVASLDVSIQAQVVNLLKELRRSLGLTYIFIAHDLDMVKYISDRIGVLYRGSIMEIGGSDVICARPRHPYTQALISAVPKPDPEVERCKERVFLRGEPTRAEASGCKLADRCPRAADVCRRERPPLTPVDGGAEGHLCACFYPL